MDIEIDGDQFFGVERSDFGRQYLMGLGYKPESINAAFDAVGWLELRQKRDSLIASCDWTQMPDSPLTEAQRTAFAEYRQALRDVPDVYDDPDAVLWPQKPTF